MARYTMPKGKPSKAKVPPYLQAISYAAGLPAGTNVGNRPHAIKNGHAPWASEPLPPKAKTVSLSAGLSPSTAGQITTPKPPKMTKQEEIKAVKERLAKLRRERVRKEREELAVPGGGVIGKGAGGTVNKPLA